MSRRTWTLVAVVLGSGIVFLDSTIVNVALRASGAAVNWVGIVDPTRAAASAAAATVAARSAG